MQKTDEVVYEVGSTDKRIEKQKKEVSMKLVVAVIFLILCLTFLWSTVSFISKESGEKEFVVEPDYKTICADTPKDGLSFLRGTMTGSATIVCIFDNGEPSYNVQPDGNWFSNPNYSVCYKLYNLSGGKWFFSGSQCGGKK